MEYYIQYRQGVPSILRGRTDMKRIYRDEGEAKLAGICAGVGAMFSIDPTIVRLAAVFICVASGFLPLIAVYAVGWVIIPTKSEIERQESDAKKEFK
jgi:phage shock protein PspC (stress-responsive transcriptional regulator)